MFKFYEAVPYKVTGKGFLGKENKTEAVITDIQGSKFQSTKQKTIVQSDWACYRAEYSGWKVAAGRERRVCDSPSPEGRSFIITFLGKIFFGSTHLQRNY